MTLARIVVGNQVVLLAEPVDLVGVNTVVPVHAKAVRIASVQEPEAVNDISACLIVDRQDIVERMGKIPSVRLSQTHIVGTVEL